MRRKPTGDFNLVDIDLGTESLIALRVEYQFPLEHVDQDDRGAISQFFYFEVYAKVRDEDTVSSSNIKELCGPGLSASLGEYLELTRQKTVF
jgi:hypothetical protein